jgi:alkylation response protein AidB-like acyl-CoA dehydrogenase
MSLGFELTDQQRLLLATATDLLDKRCEPTLVAELARDPHGFPHELWRRIAELGWPGLLVPTALGGSEASLADVIVLVEAMGRACVPGPYVASAVVATTVLLGAGPRQHDRLSAMALGDRIATLALVEEPGSFTPDAITIVAEPGERLDGRKLFVKDAHAAHELLVVGRGADGTSVFAVDRERPGVTITPLETMSDEKLFEVRFSRVELTAHDLVGERGRGWELVTPALRAGALARSAEMVGCAQRILELAVEHAKVRVQSGRPIGAFQAIQHTCADMLRNVETARWLVRAAAWSADARDGDARAGSIRLAQQPSADVAMAKAYAGEACLSVARRAHQVFGAIGYCEEHPLHLYHKRIQAASVDFGDRSAHLDAAAAAIGLVPAQPPA